MKNTNPVFRLTNLRILQIFVFKRTIKVKPHPAHSRGTLPIPNKPISEALFWSRPKIKHKKNPATIIAGFFNSKYYFLLIVSISSNLSYIFRQADYLLAIAVLIVIPNIKHHVFSIFGNNSCVAVINSRSGRAHNITGNQFVA